MLIQSSDHHDAVLFLFSNYLLFLTKPNSLTTQINLFEILKICKEIDKIARCNCYIGYDENEQQRIKFAEIEMRASASFVFISK